MDSTSKSSHLLSIECGGSKTTTILSTSEGEILGVGVSGPSNSNFAPLETVKESISSATKQALSQLNGNPVIVDLVVVATEPDIEPLRSTITNLTGCNNIIQASEGQFALAGGLLPGNGIVLICGTGSLCWGEYRGKSSLVGSWGIVGDEGSAHFIGQLGLNAAFKAWDGRGRKTLLTDRILTTYDSTNLRKVCEKIYNSKYYRKEIASIATIVIDCAHLRDEVSQNILSFSASEAAHLINQCAVNLGICGEKFIAVTTGGMFENGNNMYLSLVSEHLKLLQESILLTPARFPSSYGGILFGLSLSLITIEEKIIENISRHLKTLEHSQSSLGLRQ